MGIVRKQSLLQSLVNYVSYGLGIVNVLFVLTFALSKEEIGLLTYIQSNAILLASLSMLGFGPLAIRYFPLFEDKTQGHRGLLMLSLSGPLLGNALFLLLFVWGQERFIAAQSGQFGALAGHLWWLAAIVPALTLSAMFSNYLRNFKRTALPALFNNLLIRISLPLAALAYFYGHVAFGGLMWCFAGTFVVGALATMAYTAKLGELHLKWPSKADLSRQRLRDMASYVAFSMVGSLGGTVVANIDSIMLGQMLGPGAVGVYSIPQRLVAMMDIPKRALGDNTAAQIAKAWQANDLADIGQLYRRVGLLQLLAGGGILGLLWCNIDSIYAIIPHSASYLPGKGAVLLLGLAAWVDLGTSINEEIIGYSARYRINFYAILGLALLAVGSNWLLIPQLGLVGAALATLLAKLAYNAFKFFYIWRQFGLQPFDGQTLKATILCVASYALASAVPSFGSPWVGLVVHSGLFAGLFGSGLILGRISPDVSALWHLALAKIRRRIMNK